MDQDLSDTYLPEFVPRDLSFTTDSQQVGDQFLFDDETINQQEKLETASPSQFPSMKKKTVTFGSQAPERGLTRSPKLKKKSFTIQADSPDSVQQLQKFNEITQIQKVLMKFPSKISQKSCQLFEMHIEPEQLIESKDDQKLKQFEFSVLDVQTPQEKLRICWVIFQDSAYLQELDYDKIKFCKFLTQIEINYFLHKNFFHIFDHGVQVLQGCYSLLSQTTLTQYLNKLQQFSLIFSGLCHDVGHTGHSNAFEINSSSYIAVRYNDESVLENFHCATTFKLLLNDQCNFLSSMSQTDYQLFRKYVISNILSTDMAKHFSIFAQFSNKVKDSKINGKKFGSTEEEIKLLTGIALHSQDFNGNTKIFPIARLWSENVNKEFKQQYVLEGQKGMVQTPFMKDLDKLEVMAKAEMGFIKAIVLPLWSIIDSFLEDNQLNQCLKNLQDNQEEWEEIYLQEKYKNEQLLESK